MHQNKFAVSFADVSLDVQYSINLYKCFYIVLLNM